MSKLTEAFKKYDNKKGRRANLQLEKEMIEGTYKDNEILQRYIKIINQINKIDEEDKLDRDNLNSINRAEDGDNVNELVGSNCEVTFSKPYSKDNFEVKSFLQDFGKIDENKEKMKYRYYSEVYKKYYKQTTVKGSAKVKLLNE